MGAVVGATLGLLAFLLAFTFGMAASRYDTRRQLVLQEANAIGTTYLRAEMLPEPQRSEIRNLLREYAALRVGGVSSIMTPRVMAQSGALHDRLWADAVAVGAQSPNSIVVGLFIQSLNEMIDLDATRVTAGRSRIPDTIWLALYLVTILTMAAMGYQFGLTGEHSWPVTILLTLVFTTVILLIADLDRPQAGVAESEPTGHDRSDQQDRRACALTNALSDYKIYEAGLSLGVTNRPIPRPLPRSAGKGSFQTVSPPEIGGGVRGGGCTLTEAKVLTSMT